MSMLPRAINCPSDRLSTTAQRYIVIVRRLSATGKAEQHESDRHCGQEEAQNRELVVGTEGVEEVVDQQAGAGVVDEVGERKQRPGQRPPPPPGGAAHE